MKKKMISIWFFIGLILTVYGLLILGAGIYNLVVPNKLHVILSNLQAGVWWGALLVVLGVVYILKFRPRKN